MTHELANGPKQRPISADPAAGHAASAAALLVRRVKRYIGKYPRLARFARWAARRSGAAAVLPGGVAPPPPVWPDSYRAYPPQRYSQNFTRYLARGGPVRPEELVAGFVRGNAGNRGDMGRFFFFCLAFDQIVKDGLRGDLAELGVYKGNTAGLLAAIARHIGTTAYLFDTFEGFSRTDLQGIDADKRMEFEDASLEAVRATLGEENVRFVPGRFPESLSQVSGDLSFCMAHIDCDLYAPFRDALAYFYPRLVPGGFLIMHDYSSLHWDGAERAIDEFFADKPESVVPVPDGAGTVVVRKAKSTGRHSRRERTRS